MQSKNTHWTALEIEQFFDGHLTEDEEGALVQHLDDCADCRRELAESAGNDSWWKEAQTLLKSDPRSTADGDEEALDRAAAIPIDFLAPTDDPAMLGRVGIYEISGVIGRGGTGIVLKAFERSLNRFVAIKVLAPHLAVSAAARRRFEREAQAVAAVVHDHIVPIHAVDEHHGLPYLVMRYVPGVSLQQRVDREGPLDLCEILRIGMQTAAGLAAAHAQGLVHRDVKPANILLENGIERVMLTDFGLARTVDDASVTASGVIAGTPQYMAPEQARGEAIDHRADLFSLGSVLYFMATGHPPFRAETAMGVLHRICKEQPRPIAEANPDMPGWLSRLINRLHAKQPSARPQTAAEVADLLGRHLARIQQPGGSTMTWGEWLAETYADWKDCVGAFAWRSSVRAWHFAATAVVLAVIALVAQNARKNNDDLVNDTTGNGLKLRPTESNGEPASATQPAPPTPVPTVRRPIPPTADHATWDAGPKQVHELDELHSQVSHLERGLARPTFEGDPVWTQVVDDLQKKISKLEREARDRSR